MELSFSFENVFPGKHRGRVVELRIQGLGAGWKGGFHSPKRYHNRLIKKHFYTFLYAKL